MSASGNLHLLPACHFLFEPLFLSVLPLSHFAAPATPSASLSHGSPGDLLSQTPTSYSQFTRPRHHCVSLLLLRVVPLCFFSEYFLFIYSLLPLHLLSRHFFENTFLSYSLQSRATRRLNFLALLLASQREIALQLLDFSITRSSSHISTFSLLFSFSPHFSHDAERVSDFTRLSASPSSRS